MADAPQSPVDAPQPDSDPNYEDLPNSPLAVPVVLGIIAAVILAAIVLLSRGIVTTAPLGG